MRSETGLIGFIGPKGSGKTTAASILARRHGYQTLSFAEPMRRMLYQIGLDHQHLLGEDKEKPTPLLNGKTPRHAMQTLGTEWGRKHFGETFWSNIWARDAERIMKRGRVVCDDVRTSSEVALICNMGGTIIEVNRPGYDYTNEHATEMRPQTMPMSVIALSNNYGPDMLDERLDQIMGNLGGAQRV